MAVQLPGRENRLREPCIRRMDDIVDQLAREVPKYLELPFAFFGHSLGSLIAFELLRRLDADELVQPEVFFASGAPAPITCIAPATPRILALDEIAKDLKSISDGRTTLLKDPEMLPLLLPMLRADFEAYANYGYSEGAPLACPVIAIRGQDDNYITLNRQLDWKRHAAHKFTFHTMPGGHLFILDSLPSLLQVIGAYLFPSIGPAAGASTARAKAAPQPSI